MPRNGSGTSSVINTFVIDTIADPDEVNANFDDVADQLTNSLPRDGQAGMNAPLPLQNGTAPLPALTFSSDTDTGIYRKAANTIGFSGNGIEMVSFSPTGVSITGEITSTVISGLGIQGYLHGLTLSNNGSDATNDIDIAVGSAASDGATPYLMILASGLTKRLDAAWAVGTNAGGLDTGAIANTTYHVWLIQRSDTGVVDALFSTSATSPTMPTNYDRKRRIGSIIRESAAIVVFKQTGNIFRRVGKTDRSSTSALASALFALSVPTGINVFPIMAADMATGTASTDAKFDIGSAWEGATTNTAIRVFTTSLANTASTAHDILPAHFETNTSAQIYIAVIINSGAISAFTLATIGWVDNRGTV